jgi:hypothetical protein
MRIRLIHSKVNVIEIKCEKIEKFASCIKVSSWWHGFLVLTWCKKIMQSGKNVAPLSHIILAFRYFDLDEGYSRNVSCALNFISTFLSKSVNIIFSREAANINITVFGLTRPTRGIESTIFSTHKSSDYTD